MMKGRAMSCAAAAAACCVLVAGLQSSRGAQPAQGRDDRVLAELDANARLQREHLARMQLRYDAGRLSKNDMTRARITVLEAELLPMKVRGDRAGVIGRLREIVDLRRELLEGHRAHAEADPLEVDPAVEPRLSQELAEASVRLWEAERAAE